MSEEPELIKAGDVPEEVDLTPGVIDETDLIIMEDYEHVNKDDKSIINDMVAISKNSRLLEQQRKNLNLFGTRSNCVVEKTDFPEIQVAKLLAGDLNRMDIEDMHLQQKFEDDPKNDGDIYYLSEKRIAAKRKQLQAITQTINGINNHVDKIHNSSARVLNTMVKYRKQMDEINKDSKKTEEKNDQIKKTVDAAKEVLNSPNADNLSIEELMEEAGELGIDAGAIMDAKVTELDVKDERPAEG